MNTNFPTFQARTGQFARLTLAAILLITVLIGSGSAPYALASTQANLPSSTLGDIPPAAISDSALPDLVALLAQNAVQPLSLAAADLDEDGIREVIAGFGAPGGADVGGLLSVQRGNAAALYPFGPEAQALRAAGAFTDAPIFPDKALTGLPEAPDFLAGADLNGDGHADLLAGAAGSEVLYLLPGDGSGGLAAPQPVAIPGRLSGLLVGEFDAPDGLPEVLASLDGPGGPQLAIFAAPQGALAAVDQRTLISLPAPAFDMALGYFASNARPSLAVLAGSQLLLFHGRALAATGAAVGLPTGETRQLPFQAAALAAGRFSGTELELAILADDGRLFLARPPTTPPPLLPVVTSFMAQAGAGDQVQSQAAAENQASPALLQPAPLEKWQIQPVPGAVDLPVDGRMVRVQAAAGKVDGLAVFSASAAGNEAAPAAQMLSLQFGSEAAPAAARLIRSALPPLAAALSLRVSPAARHGLLVLETKSSTPRVLLPAAAATFTVNLAGDAGDASLADSLCDTDLGTAGEQCTLRAAIQQANFLAVPATIHFAIGSGLQKIAPTTQLPSATVPLTIDGTTQPGYTNTPLIQLSGEAQATGSGLLLSSASTVRGLVIGNFQGNGILVTGAAGSNIIENNYIGTDPTGTISNPNGIAGGVNSGIPAIGVFNSPDNTIGGTNAAARNLLSGNSGSAVVLAEAGAHGNLVQGNYIGTDVTGQVALGNGLNGVAIDCSTTPGSVSGHDNVVGGLSAGAANVISANHGAGVAIECTAANANLVQGNFLGTNYLGTAAVGSGTSAAGVLLWAYASGSVRDNVVGGAVSTARNIIAGNTFDGMRLGADPASTGITVTHNIVSGNYIGASITGAPLPNQRSGIRLDRGAVDNLIGGTRPGAACTGAANVISGNAFNGVALSSSHRNRVQGNCIGVGPDGVTTLANGQAGVRIDQASTLNVIGGNRVAGTCQDVCNTIAGNTEWGIIIAESGTLSNTVRANDIHGNGKLGINLVGGAELPSGVTPNLPVTVFPERPNNLTYFPSGVTTIFDPVTNQTLISGILDSAHPVTTTIDLYASSQVDASGFGEGEYYLGKVIPYPSGVFTFSVAGPLPKPFVSATATDAGGSTSEFGPVCGDPDGNGKTDDDGDGLCDDWELHGIDFNGDDLIDLNLPGKGANPERKDIFIEADYMFGDKPINAALQQMELAFALAPVGNPAGSPNGIVVHFVGADSGGYLDEAVDHADTLLFASRGLGVYDDFQDVKLGAMGNRCGSGNLDGHFGTLNDRLDSNCANILSAKRLVFRYVLFAHAYTEAPDSSGMARLPGQDLIVTVTADSWEDWGKQIAAAWLTTASSEWQDIQAATLMHEFGHTLSLRHGGGDDYNCKPNYLSIMSYAYQFNGSGAALGMPIIVNGTKLRADRPLTYSGQALPNLFKQQLSETAGIGGPAGRRALWGLGGDVRLSLADGPIDWNGSLSINPGVLPSYYDINWMSLQGTGCPPDWPSGFTALQGYDDWSHLVYNFRSTNSFAQGGNLPAARGTADPAEMTKAQYANSVLGSSDFDQDSIPNINDNCPVQANPGQIDSNGDGIGDACTLAGLAFMNGPAISGKIVTGTVTLAQAAPAQGAFLELASAPVLNSLPLTMTIPAGATQGLFTLAAPGVSVTSVVTVTASWAVHSLTTTLTVVPADLWRFVAPMATQRYDHTATRLSDGTVLVVGGRSQFTMNNFASPERYDQQADSWSPAGTMTTKRAMHTATLLKTGDVLVVGGVIDQLGNGWPLASAELYHPASNTWTPAGELSAPRVGHSATLLPSGKVLVVGGRSEFANNDDFLDSAELYDPSSNTWSPAASMSVRRNEHSAVLLASGRVLVAGGEVHVSVPTSTAELYDPVANTWQPAGTLVAPRSAATATLLPNGQVLLAGGWWIDSNPWSALASTELYDPATNTWKAAAPMPFGRRAHTATLLRSGQVLLTGGVCWSCQTMASTVLYDPRLNAWIWVADMNQARIWHAAVLLSTGQVLVTGGTDGNVALGSAESYLPRTPLLTNRRLYLPLVNR